MNRGWNPSIFTSYHQKIPQILYLVNTFNMFKGVLVEVDLEVVVLGVMVIMGVAGIITESVKQGYLMVYSLGLFNMY